MMRPARLRATILSSLRQERRPLALVGVLVFVLQMLLGPAAGLAASGHGHSLVADDNGIILCLSPGGTESGLTTPVPAGHHGMDSCPCGPLCLHALSAAQLPVLPVAAAIIPWPPEGGRPVPLLAAYDGRPDAAHLTARAIRAPPALKATAILA